MDPNKGDLGIPDVHGGARLASDCQEDGDEEAAATAVHE